MDDYHAFTSTTGGGRGGGGSSGSGPGGSSGCLPWILVGLAILYLIAKFSG